MYHTIGAHLIPTIARKSAYSIQYALIFGFLVTSLSNVPSADACDPCALFNTSKLAGPEAGSFALALSEQYTDYQRTAVGRTNTANAEYTKGYSTTQLNLAYDFSDAVGLQMSVPLVIRSYTERKRFQESNEVESGLGDMALFASFSPIAIRSVEQSFFVTFTGGVKLPTGDTGSLSDSLAAESDQAEAGLNADAAIRNRLAHHTPSTTGTGSGRILSIGSGSFDYIIAGSFYARQDRVFLLSAVQYTIRTEGDFDYRFDNDLVWSIGPAYFLALDDLYSVALRAVVSGEDKGQDRFSGADVAGSQLSNVFVGPEILATYNSRWIAELGLDLPVSTDTDEATLETDWRLRAALGYRF